MRGKRDIPGREHLEAYMLTVADIVGKRRLGDVHRNSLERVPGMPATHRFAKDEKSAPESTLKRELTQRT